MARAVTQMETMRLIPDDEEAIISVVEMYISQVITERSVDMVQYMTRSQVHPASDLKQNFVERTEAHK